MVFVSTWGQETKKKKFESQHPPYKETYYVLKDDQEIKHGDYKRSYRGLLMKGRYENDKRVGVWEFWSDGRLEQKFDFTHHVVTNLKPADLPYKYWIKEGETYKEIKPDQAPVFIGGKRWFYYYFSTLLRYPANARRMGIEGKVFISATITKEGEMINEKVEEGPGYGLNEEALRVFQMIPKDWIPAKVNGENVDIKILIPVSFKLG